MHYPFYAFCSNAFCRIQLYSWTLGTGLAVRGSRPGRVRADHLFDFTYVLLAALIVILRPLEAWFRYTTGHCLLVSNFLPGSLILVTKSPNYYTYISLPPLERRCMAEPWTITVVDIEQWTHA
ncbi:hypothetical protein SCLCIDRAFT_687478 [Scleroderma citrinum Foug A]|uniref:Uncharacterized protein n=1 Tax=Scleroderma citrinum Foug A TaxID=1036808 RepID=A0A0C3DSZ4_9AGAM|nr:hypothetical protein SCLCIDRAFT_687478 [Scleroderma citrinum Foug A]